MPTCIVCAYLHVFICIINEREGERDEEEGEQVLFHYGP